MYPYPPAAPHKQHQPTRQLPDYIHHARTSKRIGCAQPPVPRPISPVWRCFCRPGTPKNHPDTPNRALGAIKPVKQAKNHRKIDRSLLEKLTLKSKCSVFFTFTWSIEHLTFIFECHAPLFFSPLVNMRLRFPRYIIVVSSRC